MVKDLVAVNRLRVTRYLSAADFYIVSAGKFRLCAEIAESIDYRSAEARKIKRLCTLFGRNKGVIYVPFVVKDGSASVRRLTVFILFLRIKASFNSA